MYYGDKIKMGMIVGMSQCVVDVSKSDFILMIGRQLLFLSMILFVLFFGSNPISSSVVTFVGILEGTALTSSDSASAVSKQSSTSKSTVSPISKKSSTSKSTVSSISKTSLPSDYFDNQIIAYLIGLFITLIIGAIVATNGKQRVRR